jgi:hypothetical protein
LIWVGVCADIMVIAVRLWRGVLIVLDCDCNWVVINMV